MHPRMGGIVCLQSPKALESNSIEETSYLGAAILTLCPERSLIILEAASEAGPDFDRTMKCLALFLAIHFKIERSRPPNLPAKIYVAFSSNLQALSETTCFCATLGRLVFPCRKVALYTWTSGAGSILMTIRLVFSRSANSGRHHPRRSARYVYGGFR